MEIPSPENAPSSLTFDQVCEKLDLLFVRKLELMQEYLDLSLKSEVYQKDGYLNVAKARYTEGTHSLSSVKLPTEESSEYDAVVTVLTSEEDDGGGRKKILNQEAKASENSSKLLKQFGILSPASVKTAQASFRETLALSVDRVNVMEELVQVDNQVGSLLKLKSRLVQQPEP